MNLEQLTGECTRYLSLVHGLRDYLLHAQAALEIELEAATQREAQEAKIAAEAAAEALKRQQEAEADSQRKAAEEAQTKAEPDAVAGAVASEDAKSEAAGGHADKKEGDEDDSMVATPPLPPAERPDVAADTATTGKAGEAAKDAIVIDSDGDDDEDDVPLAFAPKPGAAIDLTDSPALANAPKPSTSATDAASTSTAPTQAGTDPAPTHASAPPATVPNTVAGIDLSALGIISTWAMIMACQIQLWRWEQKGILTRPKFQLPGTPYTSVLTLIFLAVVTVLMCIDNIWNLWAIIALVPMLIGGWYAVRGKVLAMAAAREGYTGEYPVVPQPPVPEEPEFLHHHEEEPKD